MGLRVVVRRVLVGETGPSGGPAMTDVLGVMTAWNERAMTIRPENGDSVVIALADIVSGKPVPPRPSVRLRFTAEEAERRAVDGWPPVVSEPLGQWVLRAAAGFSARANSVLAIGSPGHPVEAALDRVVGFYAARGLPAWAQVVVGSEQQAALESAGWSAARPGEADTCFQVASVAQVRRALGNPRRDLPNDRLPNDRLPNDGLPADGVSGPDPAPVSVSVAATASVAWLAGDVRAQADSATARAVLEGPRQVGFVSVESGDGVLLARGRVSCVDDWAGITDVWVSTGHRRQGLALVVMHALVSWAAERGAHTAYLQTRGDNGAALALYDRLGFVTHHEYRYVAAPA